MKTNLLTTTLLLATTAFFGQETKSKIFNLDSLHNITTEKKIFYTRIVQDYNTKKDLYVVTDYFYPSGKINMDARSKNKDVLRLEGTRIDYYENGNKKQESNYVDNKLSGKQISWYDNNVKKSEKEMTWDTKNKISETSVIAFWNPEGTQTVTDGNGDIEENDEEFYEKGKIENSKKQGIWEGKSIKRNYTFTEIYKNGKFVSGISTDENNDKHPYKEILQKPVPTKGMADFYQHIGRNFKTPNIQGLKGKIYLSFVLDKEGNPINFRILRDLGYGTGQEGIKAVASYGKWIPGKMRGIPTKVMYSLPISIQSGENSYDRSQNPTNESEMMRNTNPRW